MINCQEEGENMAKVDLTETEKSSEQGMLFDLDGRGRQLKGWTNKLIWGDNKLILSSLKNGPMREEIEKQGGIKLIYIDPPFDVGANFSMDIEIGDEMFTKEPNILEEIAYRDTWGKGGDFFLRSRLMIRAFLPLKFLSFFNLFGEFFSVGCG
jgi:adenine specific DNA methylase Mod